MSSKFSQKVNKKAYNICKKHYNTDFYNECINIFKNAYDIGQNESSMCISSIPEQIGKIPNTVYSTIFTPEEPKPAVFKLPPNDTDVIDNSKCNEPFDLFDKSKFNYYAQSYIPSNKNLQEYFDYLNVKINNNILDFSFMNLHGYKLSDFDNSDIIDNLNKISSFQHCDLLKNINTIVIYNQEFKKENLELINTIFDLFKNINEIHLGINSIITQSDINCGSNINCEIMNDNGRYILAKRINKIGGHKKITKSRRRKTKKTTKRLKKTIKKIN